MKNSSLSVLLRIVIALFSLATMSPVFYSIWSLDLDTQLTKVSDLVVSYSLISPSQKLGLGEGEEFCIDLSDSRAQVYLCNEQSGGILWQSPDEWRVEEAFFSDLNMDGKFELTLLVWRAFRPWPVDNFMPNGGRIDSFHNKQDLSCHLILMDVLSDNPREIWAGSAMADPIRSLIAVDLDGDGRQELAAIEYQYDQQASNGPLVVWRWNGFGFSLVARQKGYFSSLRAIEMKKKVVLVAQ